MMTPQQLVAESKARIREVGVADAARLLNEGALCIDVREAEEHAVESLPDTINIPRGLLEFLVGEHPALANKDRTLLVYCKSGGRSALAAVSLQRLGYKSVLSIAGGIEAWRSREFPVKTDNVRFKIQ